MTENVQQLAEAIRNAAPVVWRAAYRQVFIEGAEYILGSGFFLYAIFWARKFEKWGLSFASYPDNGDEVFFKVLGWLMIGACIGFACGLGVEAIERFINPAFAAIKLIGGLAR